MSAWPVFSTSRGEAAPACAQAASDAGSMFKADVAEGMERMDATMA